MTTDVFRICVTVWMWMLAFKVILDAILGFGGFG